MLRGTREEKVLPRDRASPPPSLPPTPLSLAFVRSDFYARFLPIAIEENTRRRAKRVLFPWPPPTSSLRPSLPFLRISSRLHIARRASGRALSSLPRDGKLRVQDTRTKQSNNLPSCGNMGPGLLADTLERRRVCSIIEIPTVHQGREGRRAEGKGQRQGNGALKRDRRD